VLEIGWILTSDEGPIQLKAVPASRHDTAGMMLAIVRRDRCLLTAQKLLNFHERGDRPGHWGVELSQLPEDSFEEVFGPSGLIEQINQFTPPEFDNDEIDEFPPWSSDDLATDLLADLSYSLGDFNQAWCAINCMGLQATSNYLKRFGDLRKGPEQREKEGLKTWFWKHKNEFDDGFYESN
jgi:hypothetical protein